MEVNWQKAILLLRSVGYNDKQIAGLAKSSRPTINRVAAGVYRHPYEPGYSGGCRVLGAIKQARDEGLITTEQVAELKTIPYVPAE